MFKRPRDEFTPPVLQSTDLFPSRPSEDILDERIRINEQLLTDTQKTLTHIQKRITDLHTNIDEKKQEWNEYDGKLTELSNDPHSYGDSARELRYSWMMSKTALDEKIDGLKESISSLEKIIKEYQEQMTRLETRKEQLHSQRNSRTTTPATTPQAQLSLEQDTDEPSTIPLKR